MVKERHRALGVGRVQPRLDFSQHDLGDERKVQFPRLAQGEPAKVAKLAARLREIIQIALYEIGRGEEKPRIEPFVPGRRGDRAENETQLVRRRAQPLNEEPVPVLVNLAR